MSSVSIDMFVAKTCANQVHEIPKAEKFTIGAIDDPLSSKIGRVAVKVLLVVGYVLILPLALPLLAYRLYSHLCMKKTIQTLAEKRCEAIQTSAKQCTATFPKDRNAWPTLQEQQLGDATKFERACDKICDFVDALNSSDGNMHDKMQVLREKVDRALKMPAYELNKEAIDHPSIYYVQTIAHALTAKAEGMEILEQYGKEIAEKSGLKADQTQYSDLVNVLDQAVKSHTTFHRDSLLGNIFWAIAHPEKALNSTFDNLGLTAPVNYNSYQIGNANIRIGAFKVGGNKMHLSLGPTPTSDRVFEAHLQYLENKELGVHFQHDLEYAAHAEGFRRLAKKEMADNHSNLTYISTPLDGDIWQGKGIFGQILNTEDFFNRLEERMFSENYGGIDQMLSDPKEDNSFYIPPKVVPEAQVKELLNITKEMFRNVEDGTVVEFEERKSVNKAQLLGFETMLAVQGIVNTMNSQELECFMGQACKQDIDRGVLLNVMTMLYFDALGNVKLTPERIHQIVGIVLVRAGMVDDRAILDDRFSALRDLLTMISRDPAKFFEPMKIHFAATKANFETVKAE